jgi:hypothetical protein
MPTQSSERRQTTHTNSVDLFTPMALRWTAVIVGDVCEIDSHLIARFMLHLLDILKYA